MCINLETSIISFILGEYFGFLLYKSNNPKKKVVGIFSMWISLVQLIEALMYYFEDENYNNLNKILALCLGLQGFVLYFFHTKYFYDKKLFFYLTLIISLLILTQITKSDFNYKRKNKCLNWKFLDNEIISRSLFFMYLSILFLFNHNKLYREYRTFLIITYLFSFLIRPIKNRPSMWCLTSALVTPLFYYYKK